MKKPLITPDETIELAFAPHDRIDPQILTDTRVEAALLKFLEPVLGKLYPALARGKYADFCREFIKPTAAYFVKYHVFLHLCVRIGSDGIIRMNPPDASPATSSEIAWLRNESRETAYLLLRKAIRHLKKHPDDFPEFDPESTRKKRPAINGGGIIL